MSWFFTFLWLKLTSPLVAVVGTTGLIGAACIAVWFLAPSWLPFNRSHVLWAGIALLGGGLFYWWAFHAGESYAYKLFAARDAVAVGRVQEAQREVDACNGGVDWDVVTGTCKTGAGR